jgi:tRNA modification GTPase
VEKLLYTEQNTIVALSTATGRSAIAVVRLTGSSAFAITARVVSPWPLVPRQATLCTTRDPLDHSLIDQCIAIAYPSPYSYTGEDTVEFLTHGGYAVSDALIAVLMQAGAREAQPGEFTRRALLNGKLDLLQVEAIGDLIDARSDSMRRVVIHQLDGSLSRRIDALRNSLLDLEALIAYDIDFPEEDHGPVARARVENATRTVVDELDALISTVPAAELVRDGAIVVIAGRPNVGKSSLFNALIGSNRAIVTAIPGTTRDAIESNVQIGEWPLRLVDTAGLRATSDVIEQLGIEVSERYLSGAHLIIACDDEPHQLEQTVQSIRMLSDAPTVAVLTKTDLSHVAVRQAEPGANTEYVHVSAHTRAGITQLGQRLTAELTQRYGSVPSERPALTRVRQRVAVERARDELQRFQEVWTSGELPAPIAAVHIRTAVEALDELIGAVDTEDVLARVFATFCIGK